MGPVSTSGQSMGLSWRIDCEYLLINHHLLIAVLPS
jgi:hypothetical protein